MRHHGKGTEKYKNTAEMYHDVVELDPLCVHHMPCEHTNTLSTVFCIVIPIVKI